MVVRENTVDKKRGTFVANINDYLLWRGDIPICEQFPFNELDSVALARFSYMLFHRIEMKPVETVGSIAEKMRGFSNDDFLYFGDRDLIVNLGESERFRHLTVTDYVQNNDRETEKQFGAVTVHLPGKEMYLSYIGTDSTIFGWKEDFNMSFMEHVPCQVAGKLYAEEVAGKYPRKRLRIGGHSKGGNVAVYAAVTLPEKVQKRIVKVYNYDGPGFGKAFIDAYGDAGIFAKTESYIPQDSIIGRILYHKEKTSIVYSVEKGLLQHDIFSWQVLRDDLVHAEKSTDGSDDVCRTLSEWIEATTAEQRKIFVDAVFELFYSTEAETFGEMARNLKENLPKILKKSDEISKENKKTVLHMIRMITAFYINILKEREKNKLQVFKNEIAEGRLRVAKPDKEAKGKEAEESETEEENEI